MVVLSRSVLEGAADRLQAGPDRSFEDPAAWGAANMAGWHPSWYQAYILKELAAKRRVSVVGPHGIGKCQAFDEPVRLADGSLVAAGDLIGSTFNVLAIDEQLQVHEGRASASDNGVRDVIEIITDKGRRLVRTFEHPLWGDLTPKRYDPVTWMQRLKPEGSWVEAKDLQPGSVVAVYAGDSDRPDLDEVSDDDIKLAAYLLGDGSITRSIVFSQSEGPVLDEFTAICVRLGCTVSFESSSFVDYKISTPRGQANPVTDKLRVWGLMGKNSYQKHLPEWLWRCSKRQVALFLSRLYACDGWASLSSLNNAEVGYCSVSRELAEGVARALLRLGLQAKVQTRQATSQRGTTVTAYQVGLHSADNILRFAALVGIYGKDEAIELVVEASHLRSPIRTQKWRRFGLPEYMSWEKVASVRVIKNQPTVAITVEKYHTYLTDFVEHNTGTDANALFWFAQTREAAGIDWKVVTTAGAWRQLQRYLWPEIHKWGKRLRKPLPRGSLLTTELKLSYGQAFAVASDETANIEGAHADEILYIIDEAKNVQPDVWDAIEGAMSAGNAYCLANSTPGKAEGRLFEIHSKRAGFEDWTTIHVTLEQAIEAGRINREWAEARKRQWGEKSPVYLNRVLGEFSTLDSDGVIPLEWLEAAIERWEDLDEAGKLEKSPVTAVAADVSSEEGVDQTIIGQVRKVVLTKIDKYPSINTMETTGKVKSLVMASADKPGKRALAVVDVIGVGTGVVDRLREQKVRVDAFQAAGKPKGKDKTKELTFLNRRAEAWWGLRDLLNPAFGEEIALPPDDEMIGDLVAPKYDTTSTGHIRIEDKDEIKKRLGRSPDVGDMVVMAFNARFDRRGNVSTSLPISVKRTSRWGRPERSERGAA